MRHLIKRLTHRASRRAVTQEGKRSGQLYEEDGSDMPHRIGSLEGASAPEGAVLVSTILGRWYKFCGVGGADLQCSGAYSGSTRLTPSNTPHVSMTPSVSFTLGPISFMTQMSRSLRAARAARSERRMCVIQDMKPGGIDAFGVTEECVGLTQNIFQSAMSPAQLRQMPKNQNILVMLGT